jgi:hypothetical protein
MKIWMSVLTLFSLFAMTISVAYADSALKHTTGNAEVAVTDFGALGAIQETGGIGPNFKFPKSGTRYYLQQFSEIWVGDANGNVASAWDLNPPTPGLSPGNWATTADGRVDGRIETDGRQVVTAQYESTRLPDFPLNLLVDQQSFSWDAKQAPGADDFIVLKLIVTNNTNSRLDGIYIAVMANWDVDGTNLAAGQLSRDWVDWDADRQTLFTFDGDNTDGTNPVHTGLTLLDGRLSTHKIFTYFTFRGQPNGQLFQDTIRSRLMSDPDPEVAFSTRQDLTDAWDYVSILSAGPYDIPAKRSVIVTFALVAGENLADFQKNVDEARRISFAPQRLTAEVVSGAVTLKWEASINPSVIGYTILRRAEGEATFQQIGPRVFDGITFDDTGITDGVEYTYKIRPVDFNEQPLPFESQEVRARPASIPNPPEGLTAALASTQIVLNWQKSSGRIGGYIVYRNHTGQEPWTRIAAISAADSRFIDTNVYSGLTYFYALTAENEGGTQGDFSTSASVSIPEEAAIVPAQNLDNVIVVPNPYRLGAAGESIEFRNLTRTATIRIYNSGGGLTKIIDHGDGKPTVRWDGRNAAGDLIAPGVYIYHIEAFRNDGRRQISTTGKFAVVR